MAVTRVHARGHAPSYRPLLTLVAVHTAWGSRGTINDRMYVDHAIEASTFHACHRIDAHMLCLRIESLIICIC